MKLFSCPDILNIPEIPTIPKISIIIQISLRFWFQKGMILSVCSNILEILNIPYITDIPEIPTILKFSSSFKSPRAYGSENVLHLLSVCLS